MRPQDILKDGIGEQTFAHRFGASFEPSFKLETLPLPWKNASKKPWCCGEML